MISAKEALQRLRDGNRRFVADEQVHRPTGLQARRGDLVDGQSPFAVVLGCSDSRVPVEVVFDQSLGDLFVIRVAGNVASPSQIGSVEYAVATFGTRLVVVMGHSNCGAVVSTLDALEKGGACSSPNLGDIVDRIRPSVESVRNDHSGLDRAQLLSRSVRANIHGSMDDLLNGSEILRSAAEHEGLHVIGSEYSLQTGEVDFFEQDEHRPGA